MSHPTPERYDQIIDDLYAGALEDAKWNRAILSIADSVGASGGLLLAFDPRDGSLLRFEVHRLDPQIAVDYQSHWTYEDTRREYFLTYPVGVPATDQMLPLGNQWKRTEIYNDFLLRVDVPNFMPAWLHKAPDKAVALSFQATRTRGPFQREDTETYRRLAPHISRALDIRDRLEQSRVRADTLVAQLDSLSFGVALLDARGCILECNGLVEELLRIGNAMYRRADGTLALTGPAAPQLAQWIATGDPPANSAEGLLRVPRPAGLPLSIVMSPVPVHAISWVGTDPRWLVVAFDPDRRIQPLAEIVARDLGLTAREGEVAAVLASGRSLPEVAQHFHVSPHTVRAQVKSIFRKAGLRSQSELVRRVLLGPAVHVPTSPRPPASHQTSLSHAI